jgi:hypothetical protein
MHSGGRSGLWVGGAALIALLCCAGPALVATIAGLGIAAWAGTHAGWIAGLAVVAPVVGVVALRRRHLRRCGR